VLIGFGPNPECGAQDEQHDRVEDDLRQDPRRVVLALRQRLLDSAPLDEPVEPDPLQHLVQHLRQRLRDDVADQQDDEEQHELGHEGHDRAERVVQTLADVERGCELGHDWFSRFTEQHMTDDLHVVGHH